MTLAENTETEVRTTHVSQSAIISGFVAHLSTTAKELRLPPVRSAKKQKEEYIGLTAPEELMDLVCAAIDQHGTLIPTAFDTRKAREAIARHRSIVPAIAAAEAILSQLREFGYGDRADFGSQAIVIYGLIGSIVKTKEGAPLRPLYKKMVKVMRARRKGAATATKKGKAKAPPGAA